MRESKIKASDLAGIRIQTERMTQSDWSFENAELANFFEHYVRKHVPFYDELHRMVGEISDWFVRDGGTVYDLGTSTGESVLRIHERHPNKKLHFVAVDSSREMIRKAQVRLRNVPDVELVFSNLNNPFKFEDADFVTAILLLHFLHPSSRPRLLREIFSGLRNGGALLIAEKITAGKTRFESMWNELYHDMKRRNGVSESEIAAKAASIRGVLVPHSLAANMRIIRQAGFQDVNIFFKWYNWVGIVAVKAEE